MSFFTQEARYNLLRAIKQNSDAVMPTRRLTASEEQFIQDYAMEKLLVVLEDSEVKEALIRLAAK